MSGLSRVEILGGGPAGLYAAILLRRRLPQVQVRLTEQNPVGATFGFGVVFSDQALEFLRVDDPDIFDLLTPQMERWRNMTLNHPRGQVTLDGVGFAAIGRLELIEILRKHAKSLDIDMRFLHPVSSLDELDADLVIGADGLNSLVRRTFEDQFAPTMDCFSNHFAWFGTNRSFDTLTQTFVKTEQGAFNAHHYRYAPERSTFIVECDHATFETYGFGEMSEDRSASICESIFSDVLGGAALATNKSMWRQFFRLWCENWVAGRHVLLGDAAHTAHFSIGSGTRLAMEDAIALVRALVEHPDVDKALATYQAQRQPIARKIVNAANTSATWYEGFASKMDLAPLDFAFDYITRSGRVDMGRLRAMAPGFMARYEADKANAGTATSIVDPVGDDTPGASEIGFDKRAFPNCSDILWKNLGEKSAQACADRSGGGHDLCRTRARGSALGQCFQARRPQTGESASFFSGRYTGVSGCVLRCGARRLRSGAPERTDATGFAELLPEGLRCADRAV